MNGASPPPGSPPTGVPPGLPQTSSPLAVSKGMATTSLVLGIVSMVCFGIVTGIPAIILGHIAHGRARKSPQRYGGAGMAIAGFIMGYGSIFMTFILAGLLLPALANAQSKAQRINCVNNMKQIGLAFRIWSGDNKDLFPFNVHTNQGGTLELCMRGSDGFDQNSALHFLVMSNELSTPRILVCPADRSKQAVFDFSTLQAANVTYLVHSSTNVDETHPEEVLARCPIHGNVLMCDGSVQSGKR